MTIKSLLIILISAFSFSAYADHHGDAAEQADSDATEEMIEQDEGMAKDGDDAMDDDAEEDENDGRDADESADEGDEEETPEAE